MNAWNKYEIPYIMFYREVYHLFEQMLLMPMLIEADFLKFNTMWLHLDGSPPQTSHKVLSSETSFICELKYN